MDKLYFLILLLLIPVFSFGQFSEDLPATETIQNINAVSDDDLTSSARQHNNIEDFRLYPNPVTHGTVTIITARNLTKRVVIFDVLGKQVLNRKLSGNVLDVSSLTSGIYIIKVAENTKTTTRKLVIK